MENERVERFSLYYRGVHIHATNIKYLSISNSVGVYSGSYYIASIPLVNCDLEFDFFYSGTAFYNVV